MGICWGLPNVGECGGNVGWLWGIVGVAEGRVGVGREEGGISCNSPWIKIRGPRRWRGSVDKGSEVGLTFLLTELTQVRELRPLPARCSIMVIADFNHSPGLLSELGGGEDGGGRCRAVAPAEILSLLSTSHGTRIYSQIQCRTPSSIQIPGKQGLAY